MCNARSCKGCPFLENGDDARVVGDDCVVVFARNRAVVVRCVEGKPRELPSVVHLAVFSALGNRDYQARITHSAALPLTTAGRLA